MTTFLYKTKGIQNPKGKPRVYFTCHPDDFEKCFVKISEDIFKTHDCAIFYTENMTEEIEEKYKESDLGQMNLFVFPITFKLLSQPNRAMDSDFLYAKNKNIPILPIMMESGLDTIYSQKDKFGELQYLDPYAHDLTAISYEKKLEKYLESVLISDEMVEKIRKAFDAYVFLSYRKKDRHYANELMKMIHSHPEFRDIAIWYDEFLTPGESFCENIECMMKDSKLFALLVTPNLLEYVDGQPNYIMAHEYPDAKNAGMDIFPTEMEETDKDELLSKFDGIPDCVRFDEDKAFKKRFAESLSTVAISENNNDPEHNFLIGLAYLKGIDVEINREKAKQLIESAAKAKLPEAMKTMFLWYDNGGDGDFYFYENDYFYHQAIKWGKRLLKYYSNRYGNKHADTLSALNNLANAYLSSYVGDTVRGEVRRIKKACTLHKKAYTIRCEILGEKHTDTIKSLNNLARSYDLLYTHKNNEELYKKARVLFEKVYTLRCEVLGEKHVETLASLANLVAMYSNNYEIAQELLEKLYSHQCEILGEYHIDTLLSLSQLAFYNDNLGNPLQARKLMEKLYTAIYQISDNYEQAQKLKEEMLRLMSFVYAQELSIRDLFCFLIDKYSFSYTKVDLGNTVIRVDKTTLSGRLIAYQIYNENVCINILCLTQEYFYWDYAIYITEKQSIDKEYILGGLKYPLEILHGISEFASEIKSEVLSNKTICGKFFQDT